MKLIVLILMLVSSSAHAGRGGMVGNGGDAVVQEFNLRGLQLAGFFQVETTVAQTYKIDAARFLEVVKTTALSSEDHLTLRGVEVDAINYPPDMRIEISRTRWTASASRVDVYSVQRRIALHEYLWIYGIDDTGYVISNAIIGEVESRAQAINPPTQVLLQQLFCDKIVAPQWDWKGAKKILNWGLDLNEDCPANSNKDTNHHPDPASPILRVLADYRLPEQETLLESMLQYGANPNAISPSRTEPLPLLASQVRQDISVTKLLLKYGANPNFLNQNGMTAFALAADDAFGLNDPRTTFRREKEFATAVEKLMLFLNAGGDVTYSDPHRSYHAHSALKSIFSAGARDQIDAVIKFGNVDWCAIDPIRHTRFFDLFYQYPQIAASAQITCPEAFETLGDGATCADAKAEASARCSKLGYQTAVLSTYYNSADPARVVQPDCEERAWIPAGIKTKFEARYWCIGK